MIKQINQRCKSLKAENPRPVECKTGVRWMIFDHKDIDRRKSQGENEEASDMFCPSKILF